jgi:hypothetical protein
LNGRTALDAVHRNLGEQEFAIRAILAGNAGDERLYSFCEDGHICILMWATETGFWRRWIESAHSERLKQKWFRSQQRF